MTGPVPAFRWAPKLLLATGLGLLTVGEATGQELPVPDRVRVFVDCSGEACDEEHLQREIAYVDWVRDRLDADVQVLVTEGETGAGGERYDLAFAGRGAFAGVDETLRYTRIPTDTDGEARDGLTATLAAGLVRYVARTPSLKAVTITHRGAGGEGLPSPADDPWHHWVFRTSLGASGAAEDRTEEFSLRASQSVSRVTEALKVGLDVAGRYEESRFETSDTTSVTSRTESYRADFLGVASLGSHWGIGVRASAERSTFRNFDLAVRVAPAVEYNVFPYGESTRRQLRMMYAVGRDWYDYEKETIYFEVVEVRYSESLSVSMDLQEHWGRGIITVEGSHFLDDFEQNRLEAYGFLQLRLFRGFGMFLEGSFARVRDQINIPRGDATVAEVLLRQRELRTDFEVEGRIGFDITFGSVFSEIVNARFGS